MSEPKKPVKVTMCLLDGTSQEHLVPRPLHSPATPRIVVLPNWVAIFGPHCFGYMRELLKAEF